MMSRALLVACVAALAAAKSDVRYTTDCAVFESCSGKELCCLAGGKMDKQTGVCNYKTKASCYLCGPVDGLAKCDDPTVEGASCAVQTDESVDLSAGKTPNAAGAGAGNGLPTTAPNSGTTMTLGTYDGMAGWDDIPASRFYSFSEFYQGLVATIPSFYTKAPYTVKYVCDSKAYDVKPEDFEGCNIFLFTYRCPPCNSRAGNVGSQLLAMAAPAWYSGNCGPTFKLDFVNGINHQFVAYSAEVGDHTETKVILEQDVEFMFWAIVGKSVVCQAKNEAECADYPINCFWSVESESCMWRVCPPHQGPSEIPGGYPQCNVCVSDEEEFIPEVKMN